MHLGTFTGLEVDAIAAVPSAQVASLELDGITVKNMMDIRLLP